MPSGVYARKYIPVEVRFWGKVDKNGPSWNGTPCWLWTGSKIPRGYGNLADGARRNILAHRLAYKMMVGDILEGFELDHLCRNHSCVNPIHLELVTHQENVLRGNGVCAQNASVTHCPKGHPYNG